MGQAFDRDGTVLGEAYGETKREVFDKLNAEFKDAHEIRIRGHEGAVEQDPAPVTDAPTAQKAQGDGDTGTDATDEPQSA